MGPKNCSVKLQQQNRTKHTHTHKAEVLESHMLGFKPWLCHFLAACHRQATDVTSLSRFLACKEQKPPGHDCVENKFRGVHVVTSQ